MKKLLLLLFSFIIISCSSTNDEPIVDELIDVNTFQLANTRWEYQYMKNDINMKNKISFTSLKYGYNTDYFESYFSITEGSSQIISGCKYSYNIHPTGEFEAVVSSILSQYVNFPIRIVCTFKYKGKMTAISQYNDNSRDTLEYFQVAGN